MAKEVKHEVEAATPKQGSKKLLIIIIALLVVVLLVGGAGAFFLLRKSHGAEEIDEEEVAVETTRSRKRTAKPQLPVYVAMDAFTVNLLPESGEQFVQLIISVEVADAESGEAIKTYAPKIRNNVMMLLSGKKASELLSREGKEKLAEEIRDQMNRVLDPRAKGDDAPVREVLFTSFIIQ